MAMTMNSVLVLMLGLAMAATSSAAVYKVGDTSGWTILGNVNYTDWAVKKTFHYPQGIHNVVEVKKADYDSCTNSSPIATHTSGDDKITIKAAGHRFFICGIPGHCAAGQKVNIRVLKPQRSSDAPSPAPAASKRAAAAAPSPAASSPPESSSSTDSSSSATTTAPAPNASAAAGGGAKAAFAAVALALVAATAMLQ
uniref:Phytocyanin domain-containing protein n=1 Tax=Oryza meridionalis TaxID=40149 RepID=A0A0E0E004_9ORYZ